MTVAPDVLDRFKNDLDSQVGVNARFGVAVSGGSDSLALLLLANAARPGQVEAATVDHALRPESRGEAEMVAGVCSELGVPHVILTVEWDSPPEAQIQAGASLQRYLLLERWAESRSLVAFATAHHSDDQAETLLMRLNRGAGVSGLSGIRPVRELTPRLSVVRPLLNWSRSELEAICRDAKLAPVADPSNDDDRFDRTHARRFLASSAWIQPSLLARSADNLQDADEALQWAADRLIAERIRRDGHDILVDGRDLPAELQRRLLVAAHELAGNRALRGPDLKRAIKTLHAGGTATLGGIKMRGGAVWRLQIAPPRRSRDSR